jgi:uncharacterized damage-inducible protein DinB
MFVDPDKDPRTEGPAVGDERTLLLGSLRWQRETLELKCSGLDAEQLARHAVEPSTMSLLGLVRHMAEIERGWFREVMAGQDTPRHFCSDIDRDGDFDRAVADPDVVARAFEVWHDEISFANEFVIDAADLDVTGHDPYLGDVSLRWVLIHMVDEYARHNGHADLLRERIDGAIGQ